MKSRLATLAFFLALPRLESAPPPEEVRVGSLGPRGVVFEAQHPEYFRDDVSGAGDVNGDGMDDFLVALMNTPFPDPDAFYLVLGRRDWPAAVDRDSLLALSTVFRRSSPPPLSDMLRTASRAGDMDGDGFDDFLISRPYGAPDDWSNPDALPGYVYLVHGAPSLPATVLLDDPDPGARIVSFTAARDIDTYLGTYVGAGPDVNGDGRPDLAFGSPYALPFRDAEQDLGVVHIVHGGAFTPLTDVEAEADAGRGAVLWGSQEYEGLGRNVALVGDANGDGLGDVLAGTTQGEAYLILGSREPPQRQSIGDLVAAGGAVAFRGYSQHTWSAVAALGDIDGDGLADFAVGVAPDFKDGAVHVIRGRGDFPAEVPLSDAPSLGLATLFTGERLDFRLPGGGGAGRHLASLDFDGDGGLELAASAARLWTHDTDDAGKVYLIDTTQDLGERRSLGEIEAGSLRGAVVTTEGNDWLGLGLAGAGDVNADGKDDLLVAAPALPPRPNPRARVYLVLGGRERSPFRVEEARPAEAPSDGTTEVLILGSAFEEGIEVTVGGVPVKVLRVETTSRLVIETPPLSVGVAEVVLRRGAEEAVLPGGLRYVSRFHPEIRLADGLPAGRGTLVRGTHRFLGATLAFLDLDGDGLADVAAQDNVDGEAKVTVVHGASGAPPEIVLEDPPLGFSRIGTGFSHLLVGEGGDLDGDGTDELLVRTDATVHIVFGGERLPPETSLDDLEAEGRVARLLHPPRDPGMDIHAAGGADLDGDGLLDLAVAMSDRTDGALSRIFIVPGRSTWPLELFLEDSSVILSNRGDALGQGLALIPDITGDGRGEILAGAPGMFNRDPGHGYLLSRTAPAPGAVLELDEMLAGGQAIQLDSVDYKDSLGHRAASPGDVDGDGTPDLALASRAGGIEFQGQAHVVFGGSRLLDAAREGPVSLGAIQGLGIRATGDWQYDYLDEVHPAGDFDGDGRADLLLGAAGLNRNHGLAYVLFGGPSRTVDLTYIGGNGVAIRGLDGYWLGRSCAGGGDFNGDGLGDVVLGSVPRGENPGDPLIYILFGSTAGRFLRGDSNASANVDLSDPIALLSHLFLGQDPVPCLDAADGNDDGTLDITDAIFVLGHLFLGGAQPPQPYPEPGTDPTPDTLGCAGGA